MCDNLMAKYELLKGLFFEYIGEMVTFDCGKPNEIREILDRFEVETSMIEGSPLHLMFEGFVAGYNAIHEEAEDDEC